MLAKKHPGTVIVSLITTLLSAQAQAFDLNDFFGINSSDSYSHNRNRNRYDSDDDNWWNFQQPRRKRKGSRIKTINYGKKRTYQGKYANDPNQKKAFKCGGVRSYDIDMSRYNHRQFKTAPFYDPKLKDYNIIVKVDIPRQKLFVFSRKKFEASGRKNGLLYAFPTSSGAHDWSPNRKIWDQGRYHVNKFRTSKGYHVIYPQAFSSRHRSREAQNAVMPWAIFFHLGRGQATHGTPFRHSLNRPASHGCLRMKEEHACKVFHAVGSTEIADVSIINRGGRVTGKRQAHRAIFIIR